MLLVKILFVSLAIIITNLVNFRVRRKFTRLRLADMLRSGVYKNRILDLRLRSRSRREKYLQICVLR